MPGLKIGTFYLAIFVALPFSLGHAVEWEESDAIKYQWEVGTQAKGGKTVGCSSGVRVIKPGKIFIEMDLTLYSKKVPPDKINQDVNLVVGVYKVKGKKPYGNSIKVHDAWVITSTGSSVGNLERNPDVRVYFGYSDKVGFYAELMEGLLADGVKIGYQEKPDGMKEVVKIPTPPSLEQKSKMASCARELSQK